MTANTETSMLDIALAHAKRGMHVFPLAPERKAPPLITAWQKKATADEAEVRKLWETNPSANVAVHAKNLLVLDVDARKGGRESLAKLKEELGRDALCLTYAVQTPGLGTPETLGWHMYYALPEGVEIANGADVFGPDLPGLDVRTTNGYVVAAGSRTKLDVPGEAKYGEYAVLHDAPIAVAHPALIARCKAAKPKSERKKDAPPIKVDEENAVRNAIEKLREPYAPAKQGKAGDFWTYKTVCLVRDCGVPEHRAAEALAAWNARCDPPWDADELAIKICNAYSYAAFEPGNKAPEAMFEMATEAEQEEAKKAEAEHNPPLKLFDPSRSRIGDIFTTEPPAPKFIVQGYLPAACGQENAIGGAGKTTRQMVEAINIILGKPVWGQSVIRSGGVLIVTKEDGRAIFEYRLHHVAKAMGLTPAERERVRQNFHLLDFSGKVGGRLVEVDARGNLQATDLAERIYTSYRQEGIVLVGFDPWNLFSPGERFVNDAEASLMAAGADISNEMGCAVRYTGHVSKMVGRQGIIDAHSGRGGAAMGDNARFVMSYVQHDGEDKAWAPPAGTEQIAQDGDLYRVHVTKQSYAKRRLDPIWIQRKGYDFIQWEGPPQTEAGRMTAENERVKLFLQQELQKQPKRATYCKSSLKTQSKRFGMSQKEAVEVVERMLAGRELVERDLPREEQQGSRTKYLEPVWPKDRPFEPGETPFPPQQ
jgi:RecA-family ATPase